jgi:hypothetical protein
MTDTVYREFELKSESVAGALWQFLKLNAKALSEAGKPLWCIVTNDAKKRNNLQNARYWKAVLKPIADQTWVAGRHFESKAWHIHYAEKFLPMIEVPMPDGSIRLERTSTTDLKVREFSEYMQQVEADAATELGVRFDADPSQRQAGGRGL